METVSAWLVPTSILFGIALGVGGYGLYSALARQVRRSRRGPVLAPDLEMVLENLPIMAVVFDRRLRLTAQNSEAQRQPIKLAQMQKRAWFHSYLREAMLSRGALVRPSNEDDPFAVNMFPLQDGSVLALISDEHDKHDTRALRRDFISNASHELNTPVAAISLLSEALEHAGGDSEKVAHFSVALRREVERLSTLTRDIAHLSQAQSGTDAASLETVDVELVTRETVQVHSALADARGIDLRVNAHTNEHDPNQQFLVLADPRSLAVALGNLIENAIKYSPGPGRVTVTVTAQGRTVAVSVADQGVGIPESEQAKIFRRFYRVDSSRTRNGDARGTGLGLAIARNTARSLRGELTLWSQVGVGSTFTMTLPRIQPQATTSSVPGVSGAVEVKIEDKNLEG